MKNNNGSSSFARKLRFFDGNFYKSSPSAPDEEENGNNYNRKMPVPAPKMRASLRQAFAPNQKPSPQIVPSPAVLADEQSQDGYQVVDKASESPQLQNRCENRRRIGRSLSQRVVESFRRRYKRRKCDRFLTALCVVELVLSAFLLVSGILCAYKTRDFCPRFSAIWTAIPFILNAIVGLVAAKSYLVNVYLAHLVFSMVSVALSAIGTILSVLNWQMIGTYKDNRDPMYKVYCLVGQHDVTRMDYAEYRTDYNFQSCLVDTKIGIAANSLQLLLTSILGLFFIASTVLCLVRTCTGCSGKENANNANAN